MSAPTMTDAEAVAELQDRKQRHEQAAFYYRNVPSPVALAECEKQIATVTRALAWYDALQRVRAMHTEQMHEDGATAEFCRHCGLDWPCLTIRALDAERGA